MILYFGGALLVFSGGSIVCHVYEICKWNLSREKALLFRFHLYQHACLPFIVPLFVLSTTLSFTWTFPVPWTVFGTLIFCSLEVVYMYLYLSRRFAGKTSLQSREIINVIIVLCSILIPFAGYLPLSTAIYLNLTGWKQFGMVLFNAVVRMFVGGAIEHLCLRLKISSFTYIAMMLLCDNLYLVHAATQMSKSALNATLVLPPIANLIGNLSELIYVVYFLKKSKHHQMVQLISLAIRDLLTISTSVGVTLVFSTVWYFRKYDYFMVDSISLPELNRALELSIINFVLEIIVFIFVHKMIRKIFRISFLDLAQAYCSSVGSFEFFGLCSGTITYMCVFLMYHLGADYYFRFEWMLGGEGGDSQWCIKRQMNGTSCYYY